MKKYLNKLHYRSWHRGTKESDLFLGKFFDKHGESLNQKQLELYDYFLSITNDNDLLLFVKGEKAIIRTDSTGQEILYVFQKGSDWIISNSFLLLAERAARKHKLSMYGPSVLGFHLKEGVHIG